MLTRETILWREKSKAKWMLVDDANTLYFYLTTVIHRRVNAIDAILTNKDQLIVDWESIGENFSKYFDELYKTCNPNFHTDLDGLIIQPISNKQNTSLCSLPSGKDTRAIVFSMKNGKSPGQDGMTVSF